MKLITSRTTSSYLLLFLLSGCVAQIPMGEQSPDLSYHHEETIVVSVIDERKQARPRLGAHYIGRAHGLFGIPERMEVYPWLESDSNKRGTLAKALEDRIVFGLNDEGWSAVPADFEQAPSRQEIYTSLQKNNASNFLLLILNDWYVSINLMLISAFNFDWDVELELFDNNANLLMKKTSSGRDIIDEDGDDNWQNMIRRAFRDRLVKILEAQELENALASGTPVTGKEFITDELERLQRLKNSGSLTDREYEALKKAVIPSD